MSEAVKRFHADLSSSRTNACGAAQSEVSVSGCVALSVVPPSSCVSFLSLMRLLHIEGDRDRAGMEWTVISESRYSDTVLN